MNNFAKILLSGVALLTAQIAVSAPPTLMIVPDKTWCVEKGYVNKSMRNGKEYVTEDYDKALIDKDFVNVQLAIKQIMAERNFPVVDAASQSEADDMDEMFDEAVEGFESGSGAATNAYDELLKRNRPDITLKVGWNINNAGSIYSADYRIEAIDTYSNKSVAPIAGQTGEVRRTVPLTVALKQTAKTNMDDFCQKLQTYFDDVQTNGREISLALRIFDSAGINFNTPFEGKPLRDIIYEWVHENSVNHQFTRRASAATQAGYTQIRIPLKDSSGVPMDAERWSNGLMNKLASLGIKADSKPTGLGLARIYIGENGY